MIKHNEPGRALQQVLAVDRSVDDDAVHEIGAGQIHDQVRGRLRVEVSHVRRPDLEQSRSEVVDGFREVEGRTVDADGRRADVLCCQRVQEVGLTKDQVVLAARR